MNCKINTDDSHSDNITTCSHEAADLVDLPRVLVHERGPAEAGAGARLRVLAPALGLALPGQIPNLPVGILATDM